MIDDLGILIYLDEILVKNINSIQGGFYGYIDIRSKKNIIDIGACDRERIEKRDTLFLEERCNRDKREGFKGYANSDAETKTISTDVDGAREQSVSKRCEEEVKQIYTSYVYHLDFYKNLMDIGKVTTYSSINKCNLGDYLHITGIIEGNSVLSYIDTLLLILEAYGEETIDQFIDDKLIKALNMKKMLTCMKTTLENCGIMDLIINNGKNRFILQLNKNYFFNNNCCITSNIGCQVNIVGKVTKVVNNNNKLYLLRKLDQVKFYEQLLRKIEETFKNIDLGIEMPILGELSIQNCIQIIPLSIFI